MAYYSLCFSCYSCLPVVVQLKAVSTTENTYHHHLPRKLRGERRHLSLLTSSSASPPSMHRPLLTLNSELQLLLVASGESEMLVVLLLGPDLTLYSEDAGMLVIRGRRLPGIVRLISCKGQHLCINVLPNPALSGDKDFPDKLLWGECLSSCLGGASFLIFITLSTILVPTRAGLTLSLALACNRLAAGTGTELPLLRLIPLGGRPLAGEQDCLLILPFEGGSIDDDRELGAPGLPLVAEGGLSDRDVLRFGGTSRENPGISEGFHGLGLTVGELDRACMGFFEAVETGLATEEVVGDFDETAGVFVAEDAVGLRVGVEALDVDLDADLGGPVGFAEDNVGREVGVEDLEGFDVVVDILDVGLEVILTDAFNAALFDVEVKVDLDIELTVGRPVGVPGLDPGPPEEVGRRSPAVEVFSPGDETCCLDDKLLLAACSDWALASFSHRNKLE
ncbi:hypothetical protein SASPL_156931 [Salvia splendens]|uniref:Uncharacterized protein n=1 Tax=Salvia splendens TaxID=180675 RepID=A0A8X8YV55_SALSN|nr:hypothetical protein SASPL_156931 [Salvia splendens]